MMSLLAYFIAFLMGFLILHLLIRDSRKLPLLLILPLAVGIGLGVSAIITFLSFLIFNTFNPSAINCFMLGLLLLLFCLNFLLHPKHTNASKPPVAWNHPSLIDLAAGALWTVLSIVIYFVASKNPFGQWDAWALWNMKTKFLVLSGDSWRDIFDKLHWHTQPDYPLLLPFMNVWIHAFSGAPLQQISLTTAVFFAMSCNILLYAGLRLFIKKEIALLASCLLLLHPYYVFCATAQYADILLAFYLLASLIITMITLTTQNAGSAALLGMLLGFLTFTKNEGIVMMTVLAGLSVAYLLWNKEKDQKGFFKLLQGLFIGLLLTAWATIFFKLFLAPPNRDILIDYAGRKFAFLNVQGVRLIGSALMREIFHERWCHIWIFILFMFFAGFRKFFYKERKILSLFFIIYGSVVIMIYLTTANFDLAWRLKSTLGRIFFYLLPSLLFCCFYALWPLPENTKPEPPNPRSKKKP